jgi:twitching motility protein PilT
MFIGTRSTNTILDVFHTGVHEYMRENGAPEEVQIRSEHCEMYAKAADINKRVDLLRVQFKYKEGTDPAAIQQKLQNARITARVQLNNGHIHITLPPFEWRHMPMLTIVDQIVEESVIETLRSKSWEVTVTSYRKTHHNINLMIEQMQAQRASDLHLRAGAPPYIRVDNDLLPMDLPPLSADDMESIVYQLGSESEVEILRTERESSFQYHSAGIGYLRVSGYYKQGAMALAIRLIPEDPYPFPDLNLPDTVRKMADARRGLVLVCGITGSGKSTTLASLVDYINGVRHAHIITTEDPVEFVYKDKKSIISQRQVGRDTHSFANALRGALREDPDVILVGEMRDMDTIRAALSAAETGHLVFSTLHTMTAVDTVNRVISYFPQAERELIRQELAYSLRGVVCQRLLKKHGGGRIPCVEILVGGKPIVRDAILEGEIEKLHNIIEVDSDMRSFDQYAVDLYKEGKVSREEAISACSDEEAFARVISGIKGTEGRKLLK